MSKRGLALMVAGVLSLSAQLRADDGEDAETQDAAAPVAAEAARNKGFKAEAANTAPATDTKVGAPIEHPSQPKTSFTPPPRRPLGAAERRAAGSVSGDAAPSASGISCEKSDPPLTRVIHKDFPNRKGDPNSGTWAVGPNEAISYKFTAPKSGGGGFSTDLGTNARIVPHMITVSETPCDFDGVKAVSGRQVGPNEPKPKFVPCYEAAGPGGTINFATIGLALPPGTPTVHICWLKPGKTYYFNIRTYLPFPDRDACAEEARTFGPNLRCGGIWGYTGAMADGEK